VSADSGRARFVAQPRMNDLPKYWAQGLDIDLGRRVIQVTKTQNWSLRFEDGTRESGFSLNTPVNLGWDTLRVKDLPVDWISINSAKPGRSKMNAAIIVHSEAKWSDEHAQADRAWAQNILLQCASTLIDMPLSDAPHITLHRWLYAAPKTSPDAACLSGDGLVLAGDWCLGGRVEGAWLSGRAAARVFYDV